MKELANFEIRGSSSSIYRNGFVAASASGCPRRTILRHLNVQEKITPFTEQIFAIGFAFEKYYTRFIPDAQFDVEVKFGRFTGHADAVTKEFVIETKSITSKNTEKVIVKQKKPKPEHLVQLVGYMIALEMSNGKLVYGNYVTKNSEYSNLKKMNPLQIPEVLKGIIPSIHEFLVEIKEDGFVYVDGVIFQNLHVTEFIDFQDKLIELVENEELPPRVEPLSNGWGSDPCHFCPFKLLCDSNPVTIEDFVEGAQEVVESLALEI